jgi:hypothetical protein
MIPVKIQCGCGQKYAFEVEPTNGRMATTVACPVCGLDGTAAANQVIAESLPAHPPPVAPGLHIAPPTPPAVGPMRPPPRPVAQAPASTVGDFSLGLGILGAFVGAAVGIGAMYGFYAWAGFRFPLLGVGIGALTGLGARVLSRGTETTLGYISGGIALISVVGTLYLMYGEFPIMSIISVLVSVSVAYRISSG